MKFFKIIGSVIFFLVVACIFIHFFRQDEYDDPSSWAIGNFVEMDHADSLAARDRSGIFYCPATENNVFWENGEIINSSAIVRHDSIFMFFSVTEYAGVGAEQSISRIGYSVSTNGLSFNRATKPVLYPDRDQQIEHEWIGGCQDPRVSETSDGRYVMFYTQCNRSYKRLAVAISSDLKNWTKYGPIFHKAYNGKYYDTDSRFASIVTHIVNGKQLIRKINGKYYLYWGSDNLYLAVSENLIDWFPVEDENGDLEKVLSSRNNRFDSDMTASGPAAVATKKGIVVFYNGANKEGAFGDKSYPSRMLGGGQALFSAKRPEKLLARLNQPFITSKSLSGKVANNQPGTIFLQGLVYFKNKWYLFYGNGDSKIQVAISN